MYLETPRFEVNTNSNIKRLHRFYHEFLVYLPVILLLVLINLIYATYFFKYLLILIISTQYKNNTFPLILTTEPSLSKNKGIFLLIITSIFFALLLIALLKTVFTNPGFFEDPDKYELNIVLKNSRYKSKSKNTLRDVRKNYSSLIKDKIDEIDETNKYLFFDDFSTIINELPLTFQEFTMLNQNMDYYLGQKRLLTIINDTTDKAAKLKMLKKELLDINFENKEGSFNPLDYDDIFDNFIGTDLLKLPLCNSCLRWKVERSHHCRQCGKCVLKMDHHCPWLANCIGFRNYKFFCLTHFYGMINSLIIAFSFWESVYNYYTNYNHSIFEESFIIFVYVCNIALMGFLFWLCAFNWTLIFSGQTVIEQSDRDRFPSSKPENVYDLGSYRNFTAVFGKNPLMWFIPFFANYEGEGIVFEANVQKK